MDNVEERVISISSDQDIIESIYGKPTRPTNEEMQMEYDFLLATQLTDNLLKAGLISEDEHKAIMKRNKKSFPTMLNRLQPDD